MSQSNVFITDFDNTIAFYNNDDNINENELITLPKSIGSNKIAYILIRNRDLLLQIHNQNVTMLCASGMREATMLQRYNSLPFIKYWICENGGKIFQCIDNKLIEIIDWQLYLDNYQDNIQDLSNFTQYLMNDGWHVDSNGYKHMIRIKINKPNNNNYHHLDNNQLINLLISKIPQTLKYTFNLGYMDVYISQIGKYQAVKWLLEYLKMPCVYSFMGDDDNDVEIASYSQCAYIVEPCSESMRGFVESCHNNGSVILSNSKAHLGANHLLSLVLNKYSKT